MTGHFSITRKQTSGRRPLALLELSGEFDIAARDDLRAAIVRAVATGSGVTIDLGDTTFLDSEALSALIDGYHAARAAGVLFKLTGARGPVRRVLEVTGVLGSD
jgi:anti-sigma B factor antagonist